MYLASTKFKTYLPDWATTVVLLVVFFGYLEHATPFIRQFSISDQSISHPFAVVERVNDVQLYLWAVIVPSVVLVVLSVVNASSQLDRLHLIQVSSVGLWFTAVITSVVTDILKCLIGNHRPDFLQRCGAAASTPAHVLVGLDVCTAPMGQGTVVEGLKSTPSGHSSLAFAGLGYLTLWLLGQYKLLNLLESKTTSRPVALWLVLCSPLLLAAYIALSRTQDYRHHFFDVAFGSFIGIVFAIWGYFHYFHSLLDANSHLPLDAME
ncbi:diacylglycerol pyrophosphate phosphatase [Suhomyces tanzawaensis NRRL Y-17324]|uniref:Diacylglycerol pyrophosphate phosphatase n=1 Tax=Suhomyces tanzawaensis NRRL Y-17324 TaxID=984487 RepID=A0A1E4SH15_9ASCO|nr:diacylglycerol pyrophosphate phosphatase [Suhomyces tanzawaensis NRRL Y-17324]ODV78798.1 diacylglycerol pyrophosphate phosphatase [Suhomyces tanzawaensis NRRL Y-17324]